MNPTQVARLHNHTKSLNLIITDITKMLDEGSMDIGVKYNESESLIQIISNLAMTVVELKALIKLTKVKSSKNPKEGFKCLPKL